MRRYFILCTLKTETKYLCKAVIVQRKKNNWNNFTKDKMVHLSVRSWGDKTEMVYLHSNLYLYLSTRNVYESFVNMFESYIILWHWLKIQNSKICIFKFIRLEPTIFSQQGGNADSCEQNITTGSQNKHITHRSHEAKKCFRNALFGMLKLIYAQLELPGKLIML